MKRFFVLSVVLWNIALSSCLTMDTSIDPAIVQVSAVNPVSTTIPELNVPFDPKLGKIRIAVAPVEIGVNDAPSSITTGLTAQLVASLAKSVVEKSVHAASA